MLQNGLHCWEETYCSAQELLLPTKLVFVKAVCYKTKVNLIINWRLSSLLGQKHHDLMGVHVIHLLLLRLLSVFFMAELIWTVKKLVNS